MSIATPRNHLAVALAFAGVAAAVAVLLGLTTMFGWLADVELLRTFGHRNRIPMNPVTSVCFVLSGVALWAARDPESPRGNWLRLACSAPVLLAAGLKLLDLLPQLTIPVDQLLLADRLGGNRMAPNTALCFTMVGAALLLLQRGHVTGGRIRLSTSFALCAIGVALLALTGYLYNVQALYQLGGAYIGMALNTGLGLLMLATGILCVRPDRQPIATLVSGTAGGVVARRLVPVALFVPLLIGWVRLKAERAGVIDTEAGVMLFAVSVIAVFLSLVWWISRSLYLLDHRRAAAEAAVADNYQLLRTLIDNLPDRIYAKDTDSRFLINNAAHLRILGAAGQHAALGKRDEDFWSHEQATRFHEEERRIIATGEAMIDQEQRRTSPGGEERWVTATKIPFRNAAGEVAGLVGITHDITAMKHAQSLLREQNDMLQHAMRSEQQAHDALKRAQSQLVQNEKLASLGQMVAGVAHEINNPLSFVANNTAVLQRDLKAIGALLELYLKGDAFIADRDAELAGQIRDAAERIDLAYTLPNLQDMLARSREGLRRIQQIVKDLRDFARLDEADLHDVDLNDGIRSTANIIHGLAKKQQVKVDLDLAENLPTVSCYPAKVNQVVMNLLSNAIQASSPNTTVTVRTRRNGDGGNGAGETVTIEVADQGSGIPPHVRDRIFDPFFTTKPPGEGTGLGLSISYGIIHDHGGQIAVDSEVGKGSTFTVTLPVKAVAKADARKTKPESNGTSGPLSPVPGGEG